MLRLKMYVKVIFYEEMFGNKNVKVKLVLRDIVVGS